MKIAMVVIGLICVFLGGLWCLQGLGLIHVEPILCVGNCEAIESSSPTWAVIGLVVFAAGAVAIYYGVRRRRG